MTEHLAEPHSKAERLDVWLWAARFYKTRSLAAEAIKGGKVQVEDQRAKPAKLLRLGNRLRIRKGPLEWELILKGFSKQRLSASEAVLLYAETPESIQLRAEQAEIRSQLANEDRRGLGRPTKRDRRRLAQLKGH
jgi:ribosome-associated heat shock protein Hsp15